MSQIKAIYARTERAVMGKDNTLPWNVPADMKRFRRLTSGCIVVMGYKTFLSLGSKPLPNRLNIVVADPGRAAELPVGVLRAGSLTHAVALVRADARSIWVIGGPDLIAAAMERFDAEVHRTTLELPLVEGDVFSHTPDARLGDYVRVGYESFRCNSTGVPVEFERFVKAGVYAGTK